MIKSRKIVISLAISLIIISLFVSVAPVFAYSYSGYRWAGNFTLYDVSGISSSAWRTAINNAANTWTNAGANFYFISSSSSTNDWGTENLGDVAALATSYVAHSSGYIVDCDTKFNVYHSFYTNGNQYDVQSVALHEFGHWLFLNDIWNIWDFWKVMYGHYTWSKHNLSSDEVSGIIFIYGED
jgi:hypothetical protein